MDHRLSVDDDGAFDHDELEDGKKVRAEPSHDGAQVESMEWGVCSGL